MSPERARQLEQAGEGGVILLVPEDRLVGLTIESATHSKALCSTEAPVLGATNYILERDWSMTRHDGRQPISPIAREQASG